ncbi:hypothetical protein X797_007705 [Metarhizium robertsii]|uniref:Uncharacterized protein n=1 Tax=Metarhizium robertsii TaxID=568076 RepID=A0A014P7T6_9HYPO|nr:hypothetical protein X797_007705 [Metarhizium robertsii]
MQGVEGKYHKPERWQIDALKVILSPDCTEEERIQALTKNWLESYNVIVGDLHQDMTKNQEVEQILKTKNIQYYQKWAFYENFAVEWVFRGPRGAFSAPAEFTLPLVLALQQAGWKKIQGKWGEDQMVDTLDGVEGRESGQVAM